jgi:hypothetical protein
MFRVLPEELSLATPFSTDDDNPSMCRLFDTGERGTGVKDAYAWDLPSWICKIRHCWSRKNRLDSIPDSAVDNGNEFNKRLIDAETIPRCLAYKPLDRQMYCTRMQFKQESACVSH